MIEARVDHVVDWVRSFRTLFHGIQDPIAQLGSNVYRRLLLSDGDLVTLRISWSEPRSRSCFVEVQGCLDSEHIWAESIQRCVAIGPRETLLGELISNETLNRWFRSDRQIFQLKSNDTWAELIPSIIGQRITTTEAAKQWQRLAQMSNSYPTGIQMQYLNTSDFHKIGIEIARARTLQNAAIHFDSIRSLDGDQIENAYRYLRGLPGVGPWTSAETLRRSHGWTDAVSEGDFHLARHVVFALTGRAGGNDQEMLEILEPFRPYRALVVDSVLRHGKSPGRTAPGLRNLDIRRM